MTVGIFIPTKDRAQKLAACLESCSRSTAKNVKFIVLDNASDKATENAFDLISHDRRFEYRRYDTRGSINEQFIRAARLSTEKEYEWSSIIGDDDAVCASGFDKITSFLEEKKTDLQKIDNILWDRPIYRWPDYAEKERGLFTYTAYSNPELITVENSRSYMPDNGARTVKAIYESPGIYHRLVRGSLINDLFVRFPETLFAHSPDISFGAHNALEGTNCLRVRYPVTILGYSSESTGSAFSVNDNKSVRDRYLEENKQYIQEHEEFFKKYAPINFVAPPVTEVSGTFLILNKVLMARGMQALSIDLYVRSEVLNLRKISIEMRTGFEKFLLALAREDSRSIPNEWLELCRSTAAPSSLGDPVTNLILDDKSKIGAVQQTIRLPVDAISTASAASALLEALVQSLSRTSIR